ncbi:DUF2971 domain-containing protein [Paenibacillus sp. FSL R7-0204]|uniref:DUF2971 domain-containing protein n=1 Tax=Paenibacillus sp. FSL R7-0204 TaxID=2921675 RepID=UPI0030F85FB8
MSYTYEQMARRINGRSDMSIYLTHLTRRTDTQSEVDTLLQIIKEQVIRGSNGSGYIIGEDRAACFQDAPLHGISQNIIHENQYRKELGSKLRYDACGVSFSKQYVYLLGGRPCVYEKKEVAKKILPPEEWWRIVNFDMSDPLNIVDWTHEREWRVKGDFIFHHGYATVLLPHNSQYREFIDKVDKETLKALQGLVVLSRTI